MKIKVYKYTLSWQTRVRTLSQKLATLGILALFVFLFFYGANWAFKMNYAEDIAIDTQTNITTGR